MWQHADYRKTSPAYHRFFDTIRDFINPGESVIDFGCGTGLAASEVSKTNPVTGIDIADNCRSVSNTFEFVRACLWEPLPVRAASGYCVDVMEHIPPEKVSDTFSSIMAAVPRCLFIACKLPDRCGERHGVGDLHLTIKNDAEWLKAAVPHGKVTKLWSDARAIAFKCER